MSAIAKGEKNVCSHPGVPNEKIVTTTYHARAPHALPQRKVYQQENGQQTQRQ